MQRLKFSLCKILLLFSICNVIHAQANFTVPFENVFLTPQSIILATYSFGQNNIIFCYENTLQTVGVFTWPFQGTTNVSTLPITLITNPIFQGSFADATGTIFIQNNQTITLVVSCLFAF